MKLARAIHDPTDTQGASMQGGKERDAVFITNESIHIYEFTVSRTKDKATQDAKKIIELIETLHKRPENSYKNFTGWFVTREEPTADQRQAIAVLLKNKHVTVHAISIATLYKRLCDSEAYLAARENAPFGSIVYASQQALPQTKVEVSFTRHDSQKLTVRKLSEKLISGSRNLLTGEFGVGKSHALREIYFELRKRYFKGNRLTPFPVHINLRDCTGLRYPSEILRRHAEEIGFADDRSLISAWRAGACILLLDGFDEIVPSRWLGSASDLKGVRWEALSPIRRLVEETPHGAGIIACGRSHYFSSPFEMADTLGFESESEIISLQDFDQQQVADYLELAGVKWKVPEWMPTRPLLIGYLIAMGSFTDIDASNTTQADAWRKLFHAICQRESRIYTAVRPETIRLIVSRLATLARSKGQETGPVDMEMMKSAFADINGREADEEGIQLLLRLPGFAIGGYAGTQEQRVFADRNLAETAYGEDLATYLVSPYEGHPLSRTASWGTAANSLGVEIAASALLEQRVPASTALAAASRRQDNHQFDAVLADSLRVSSELNPTDEQVRHGFLVEGVIVPFLAINGDDPVLSRTIFRDSLIDVLDLSGISRGERYPTFQSCIFGYVDGMSGFPSWLKENFIDCEVEKFSTVSETTSGIMDLKISPERRVALTVLKKVYNQPGSGRKEEALSRGLDMASRELVPNVLNRLVSDGWLHPVSSRGKIIYVPVKGRRAAALQALESPNSFHI
ncbi:NACHT domain-containing protein [Actinomadura rugatobispora]|uniref:NACHT domain-containing protein n=1 Tax=Actinomadura rugatobispora TaxID=1994 RepID=A0ABW1A9N4_9ACTN